MHPAYHKTNVAIQKRENIYTFLVVETNNPKYHKQNKTFLDHLILTIV